MKKYRGIIILIILAIVAAYFFFTRTTSTIKNEFSEFEIEDTSSVDRIFIADENGVTADLTRQEDNTWRINDKYKARQDAVELLLKTFRSIKVKEIVPKAALENVIKYLATRSFKVEIYTGGSDPHKVYYVGNSTKDHHGTYMLLEIDGEKSSMPFITHLPGLHGFLTARFFTEEDIWRDRTVFAYKTNEIKRLSISYLEKPTKSFELKNENGGYVVTDLSTKNVVEPLKEEAISEFLSRFRSVHFEYIQREGPLANIDSVTSTLPLHIIEIEGLDGSKTTVKTYNKPVKGSMIINEATGHPYKHDLDRLFAWVNDSEFVVMQWPTLDRILAYNSDFGKLEIVDN